MRSLVAFSAAALTIGLGAASCGNAAIRSAERFCGELAAHATELQTAPETVNDIPAFITLYSKIGETAPLEIEGDWATIYRSLRTADTVDAADPTSVQRAADAAYATQQSAEKVVEWAEQNCGITLRPVGQVPGGAPVAESTTTEAPLVTG